MQFSIYGFVIYLSPLYYKHRDHLFFKISSGRMDKNVRRWDFMIW